MYNKRKLLTTRKFVSYRNFQRRASKLEGKVHQT